MEQQEKKVSLLLAVGIVFMPYIFSWFLLKDGYSKKARTWGLGWAAIIILMYFSGERNSIGSKKQTEIANTNQAQQLAETPSANSTTEKAFNVPSDSKAQFFVLEKGGSGSKRTIVTKRVSSSGTSYSKRLYNCENNTVKYLGTGDSLAEMTASKADQNMAPIVQSSIAYYVGLEACSENPTDDPIIDKQLPEVASAGLQWSYSEADDPMSNGTTYHAVVLSSNTVEFDFPYSGAQNAKLHLRIDPKYGKDVIFSIEKGQILCNSSEDCTVLVRFDDEKATNYSAASAADNSTETIFIRNYARFIEKMLKAKRVRISTNIYQEGAPVFEFDVSGFDQEKYKPKT